MSRRGYQASHTPAVMTPPGSKPVHDERRAFEAGYRWGYGNGHCDAEAPEPFNSDPLDAYFMWVEEDNRDDAHRQLTLPGGHPCTHHCSEGDR